MSISIELILLSVFKADTFCVGIKKSIKTNVIDIVLKNLLFITKPPILQVIFYNYVYK